MVTAPPPPAAPRLARLLMDWMSSGDDAAFLAADLTEEFEQLAANDGAAAARRWYWKQVCLSAPPLLRHQASSLLSLWTASAPARRAARVSMLHSLFTDLRHTWRVSRRAPVATISVTVAIALGIAATTAIFSVMESVFLRPLPFLEPDRLVRFSTTIRDFGLAPEVNYLDAQDWRNASTRLQGIGLYDIEPGTVRVAEDASPFSITVMSVTPQVIPVLGMRPVIGRELLAEEYGFGAPKSLMLG
jgi:hypothetical protein